MVSRSFGSASPAVFSYRRAPNSLDDIFIVRQTPPFMRDPCTLKSLRSGGRRLHSAQLGDCQAKTERSEK
jgi:hypothetical protein